MDGPPQVITVRQLDTSFYDRPGDIRDPATHGLLVAVLFDKPVTEESAETIEPLHSGCERRRGRAASAQRPPGLPVPAKRIGTFVERQMTLAGIADLRGSGLFTTTRTIDTVLANGGRLFGHVQTATGQPVPNALMSLTIVFGQSSFLVATVRTDRDGAYDFDYVTRLGDGLVILAQHPVSLQFTQARARFRAIGERLLVNPTFLGRGRARGRVLAADGVTPVPEARVVLYPSAIDFGRHLATNANAIGEYAFTDVPVGTYTVKGFDGAGGFGESAGVVPQAEGEGAADIVLTHQRQDTGRLIGRVFLSDGATPAARLTVYVGSLDRRDPAKPTISVVDQTIRTTPEASRSRPFSPGLTTSWRSTRRQGNSASRGRRLSPTPRIRRQSSWRRPALSRASCSTRRAIPSGARWSPAASLSVRPTSTASSGSRASPRASGRSRRAIPSRAAAGAPRSRSSPGRPRRSPSRSKPAPRSSAECSTPTARLCRRRRSGFRRGTGSSSSSRTTPASSGSRT